MKKIKFWLVNLAYWLLYKTRQPEYLIIRTEISEKEWKIVIKQGRISVLLDCYITGIGREIMVGDLRKKDLTHEELLKLIK